MKLIVGLGNPGKKYENTRHNTGYMCVDAFARSLNVSIDMKKFNGLYVKTKYKGEDVVLLKPETFMNNSGESVGAALRFFKMDPKEDLVVIYDDMDLDCGRLRLREQGGPGGHNGMKSIIAHTGTNAFKRIRVGIGRPVYDTVDYVLGRFSPSEMPDMDHAVTMCVAALECIVSEDFTTAMNRFNKK